MAMMKPTRKVSEDDSGEGESVGEDRSDMADEEDGGGGKKTNGGGEEKKGFGRFVSGQGCVGLYIYYIICVHTYIYIYIDIY